MDFVFTYFTVPSAPSDLTLTPTDTTIQVNWTLPSDPCPADNITVMWRPAPSACPGIADGMMVISSTDTSYTIMGLEEYTPYEVSVLISNAAGTGPSTSDTKTTLPISEIYFCILALNSNVFCRYGKIYNLHCKILYMHS